MELLFKDESYRIMGCCFEVYKDKGCGFAEPVYQECLEIEFALQGLPAMPQKPLALSYKGRILRQAAGNTLPGSRSCVRQNAGGPHSGECCYG